jgi:hypothetical protein
MTGKEADVLDYFSILMKYGPGLVLMCESLHVTTIPIISASSGATKSAENGGDSIYGSMVHSHSFLHVPYQNGVH